MAIFKFYTVFIWTLGHILNQSGYSNVAEVLKRLNFIIYPKLSFFCRLVHASCCEILLQDSSVLNGLIEDGNDGSNYYCVGFLHTMVPTGEAAAPFFVVAFIILLLITHLVHFLS